MPLIGSDIRHVEVTGSTMDDVALLAREGVSEGAVVRADRQTSGRGRHARAWVSSPGDDLLLSILFRPRPAIAVEINILLAVAIAEVIEAHCEVSAKVKWPNDVRVDGRKVAGILLESSQDAAGLAVVAGVGLNVNSRMAGSEPGGAPAISMSELAGRRIDVEGAFSDLLARIDALYAEVRGGGTVVPVWRDRLETLGTEVEVRFVGGSGDRKVLVGVAEDVDDSGRLLVRDTDDRLWPVAAGEVTLRGSWSDQ